MKKFRVYKEGYVLKDNEYMLKIRIGKPSTGFLSKFNKSGSMPVAFDNWGTTYHNPVKLPIYVFEERPRSGWKLHSWRFGQSQNWATVIHPEGFTLEIYLQQFLEIIEENTIINGVIQGSFYWADNKLIRV